MTAHPSGVIGVMVAATRPFNFFGGAIELFGKKVQTGLPFLFKRSCGRLKPPRAVQPSRGQGGRFCRDRPRAAPEGGSARLPSPRPADTNRAAALLRERPGAGTAPCTARPAQPALHSPPCSARPSLAQPSCALLIGVPASSPSPSSPPLPSPSSACPARLMAPQHSRDPPCGGCAGDKDGLRYP